MAGQQDSNLSIVFSDSERGALSIGPLYVDPASPFRQADGAHNFIFGPITLVLLGGTRVVRESGNGFDALRFPVFREDLRTLERERSGRVLMGDHDYGQLIELLADGSDAIRVSFSVPVLDVWDLEVATIDWHRIASMIDRIDAVERALGPLTGYCPTCRTPSATYQA